MDDGLIYVLLLGATNVTYQLESGFAAFNLYRGGLDVLTTLGIYTQSAFDSPAAAQFCGLTSGSLSDWFTPIPGGVVYYLASSVSGMEGSLGTNSAGQERPNDNPCP